MFITLSAVTFGIALVVTTIVARAFQKSITGILGKIFISEIAATYRVAVNELNNLRTRVSNFDRGHHRSLRDGTRNARGGTKEFRT